jgi:alpha-beta hydrolase superfamily lysophospholipase
VLIENVAAELKWTSRPDNPKVVVLLLHGGSESSQRPAQWHNMAVMRMVPIARTIAKTGNGAFAVALLRYAVRGWNGTEASPIVDARKALDDITQAYPGVPIALVGHSMGGRVGLAIADDARVVEVIGLAPWVVDGDGVHSHEGQKTLLLHGVKDRTTSAAASKAIVEALQERGLTASFVGLKWADHAMLRRAATWGHLVSGYLTASFLPKEDERDDQNPSPDIQLGAQASEKSLITVI